MRKATVLLLMGALMCGAQNQTTPAGPYRIVYGKLCDTTRGKQWKTVTIKPKSKTPNGVIADEMWASYAPSSDRLVSSGNFLGASGRGGGGKFLGYVAGKEIVVFNTGSLPTGERTTVRAICVGTKEIDGKTLEAWDCGTVPTKDDWARISAEQAEQKKAADERLAQRKKEAQAKVLKYNEEKAASGDPFALKRLGEVYRDGDGVEKDLAKAKDYFAKAAAAGNQDAAKALAKLNGN